MSELSRMLARPVSELKTDRSPDQFYALWLDVDRSYSCAPGKHRIHLQSWENHQPRVPHDAIVSLGAFEHFARPGLAHIDRVQGYRLFFEYCHRWLEPGGSFYLQTICYDLSNRSDLTPFFRDWVFPESDLPRVEEIFEASRGVPRCLERRDAWWLARVSVRVPALARQVGPRTANRTASHPSSCAR